MRNPQAYSCPCCGMRLPFRDLFVFQKGHTTICASCSTALVPISARSFKWGFGWGFIGFIVPAELIKMLYQSPIPAFFGGIAGAALTILTVALYIRKTTHFKPAAEI